MPGWTYLNRISAASSALLDGLSFHGLSQINTIVNSRNNVLDLVLLNDIALSNYTISEAAEALTPEDEFHSAIQITIFCPLQVRYESTEDLASRDFRRANFEALNAALSATDWTFLDTSHTMLTPPPIHLPLLSIKQLFTMSL